MTSTCAASSLLQLPDLDDFGGEHSILRTIDVKYSCSINTKIAALRLGGGEGVAPISSWSSEPQSGLCVQCDFCALVFEALSRRYGTAIQAAIQKSEQSSDKEPHAENASLVLKLSGLRFYPYFGCYGVAANVAKYKGISHVVLEGNLTLTLGVVDTPTIERHHVALPFETFAEDDDVAAAWPFGIYRRELTSNPLSDGNLRLIRNWLGECIDEHINCSSPPEGIDDIKISYALGGEPIFLPSRLLSVGDPLEGISPRVVSRDEILQYGRKHADEFRYLALSYCWGSSGERHDNLISDVSTIQERMKAVQWEILPRTFQDVITLAKELGIHYVWIDSLCIIQGEGGDWQEESGKMWSVFSNAYMTVVAAAGSSPHSGFLTRPLSKSFRVSNGSAINYSIRIRPGTKWTGSDKMAEITGKRWITRGWTYQEERLARRVLMFGENKFFYDCRERERSEDSETWLHRPSWSRIIYTHASDSTDRTPESQRMRRLFSHWQWLCTQYSHRMVSIPEDKLPAFSGVAAAVAAKTNSRYLAGLWEDNLEHDLLWDTIGEARSSPVYRAPSWSWVSLNTEAVTWSGIKTCQGEFCQFHCQIIAAETFCTGSNPFGAIKGAYLSIEGYYIEVKLARRPGASSRSTSWSVIHEDHDIAQANLDMLHNEYENAANEEPIWALLVVTCGNNRRTTRGLLLEQTERKQGKFNAFRRLGTFTFSERTDNELKPKLSFWNQSSSRLCVIE